MALATAKLFAAEGTHAFITGRRKDKLDEAAALIGQNVTSVQGDAASLADLDHLYEVVRREKNRVDILLASVGQGELVKMVMSPKKLRQDLCLEYTWHLFLGAESSPLFRMTVRLS